MILLTGPTGFLGSRLLARFLETGEEVVACKRSTSNTVRIDHLAGADKLHLVDLDLIDPETLFKSFPIDTIVHCATQYGRRETPVYTILEANLILPLRLAELGIKYGTRCFVNTDSYFNKNNSSYSNLLDYSLSKKSLLTWLNKLSDRLQIINVILEHIYGPFDSETKFVESLFQQIAVRQVGRVALTHGHQKRDFIYIDDVVDAYVKLVAHGRTHHFRFKDFEVGTGVGTPIRDLAVQIRSACDSTSELGFGDIDYRSDEIMSSTADTSALRELGWAASTSVADGVHAILNAYGVQRSDVSN